MFRVIGEFEASGGVSLESVLADVFWAGSKRVDEGAVCAGGGLWGFIGGIFVLGLGELGSV